MIHSTCRSLLWFSTAPGGLGPHGVSGGRGSWAIRAAARLPLSRSRGEIACPLNDPNPVPSPSLGPPHRLTTDGDDGGSDSRPAVDSPRDCAEAGGDMAQCQRPTSQRQHDPYDDRHGCYLGQIGAVGIRPRSTAVTPDQGSRGSWASWGRPGSGHTLPGRDRTPTSTEEVAEPMRGRSVTSASN
eukprot:2920370-Rhodomonas_salina.1